MPGDGHGDKPNLTSRALNRRTAAGVTSVSA
jgi:hypothetical protein